MLVELFVGLFLVLVVGVGLAEFTQTPSSGIGADEGDMLSVQYQGEGGMGTLGQGTKWTSICPGDALRLSKDTWRRAIFHARPKHGANLDHSV